MGLLGDVFGSTIVGGSGITDQLTGQAGAEASLKAAELETAELKAAFDQAQANQLPFLQLAQAQLPGLQEGATAAGIFADTQQLLPLVQSLAAPGIAGQQRDLQFQLASQGLSRSGFAGEAAADVVQDALLPLLVSLGQVPTSRQQQLSGFESTGQSLSGLGQQASELIGQAGSTGILGAQQSRAAGTQNLLGLTGALGQLFAPSGSPPPLQGQQLFGSGGPQRLA